MTPTNGLKTSEFITSLIPIVLGLILIILGVVQKNAELTNQGMALMISGSGIYGVSRGLTKLGSGIGGGGAATPEPTTQPTDAASAAAAIAKIP